uniref:(California timema) hypothetical protein n=1 Tax=Timema californicum TaxID=61474 RepID=A0A7R9JAT7_TIMCA|nr:unnamed protein product [Timema californicum]
MSSPMASLVLTDSSQLTSNSQHLGIYSSPMASLVLTDSSQLTSDSQHLGIYSSPMASLVLTDSSQLTSDSQHLDHKDCRFDNVTVLAQQYSWTTMMTEFGSYCGNNIPPVIVQRNRIEIIFKTDRSLQKTGFLLQYEVETCGGNITEQRLLKSPASNNQINSRVRCNWLITAPLGKRVTLRFTSLKIEYHTSCNYDYIEAYDDKTTNKKHRMGRYCGNLDSNPPKIHSTGRYLSLLFVTDGSNQGEGFLASVMFTTVCGGIMNVSQRMQTLRYPVSGKYAAFLDCAWTLVAPLGQIVQLQITSLDMASCFNMSTASCDCDYLEVHDGVSQYSELIGRFCGNTATPAFTSSSNKMWIHFVSDAICGNSTLNVTSSLQELTSPNYPGNYPVNIRCRWLLTFGPVGNRWSSINKIYIHFKELDLETGGDDCRNDRLQVSDVNKVALRVSHSSLMSSDSMKPGSGDWVVTIAKNEETKIEELHWHLHERMMENNYMYKLSLLQPVVSRMNNNRFISEGLEQEYIFSGQSSDGTSVYHEVALRVSHSSLMSSDRMKPGSGDWAVMINFFQEAVIISFIQWQQCKGSRQPAGKGTFCGHGEPLDYYSDSANVQIVFVSNFNVTARGFKIQYGLQGCRRNYTGVQGRIKLKAEFDDCIITIQAQPNHTISLYFLEFYSMSSDGCNNNYLEVSREAIKLGVIELRKVQSIKYIRNGIEANGGSKEDLMRRGQQGELFYRCLRDLLWRREVPLKCKEVSYEVYFVPFVTHAAETWTVNGKKTTREIKKETAGDDNRKNVRDGLTPSSPRLAKLCGSQIPSPIFSNTSALRLFRHQKSAFTGSYDVIDITYTTTDQGPGCGGTLFNFGGVFTSPFYPGNYRNNSKCRWDVMVPTGLTVVLKFYMFDLGSSVTCDSDYIEFFDFDVVTKVESFRTKYCGGEVALRVSHSSLMSSDRMKPRSGDWADVPAVYEGVSAHVVVRYTSSVHNGGTGWVLHFMGKVPAIPETPDRCVATGLIWLLAAVSSSLESLSEALLSEGGSESESCRLISSEDFEESESCRLISSEDFEESDSWTTVHNF